MLFQFLSRTLKKHSFIRIKCPFVSGIFGVLKHLKKSFLKQDYTTTIIKLSHAVQSNVIIINHDF